MSKRYNTRKKPAKKRKQYKISEEKQAILDKEKVFAYLRKLVRTWKEPSCDYSVSLKILIPDLEEFEDEINFPTFFESKTLIASTLFKSDFEYDMGVPMDRNMLRIKNQTQRRCQFPPNEHIIKLLKKFDITIVATGLLRITEYNDKREKYYIYEIVSEEREWGAES